MDQDDNFYIDKVLKNDLNAYSVLVDRHKDMVYSIAVKILKNEEDAEELAQDVFVKAYQSLKFFKRESKFSTWLYRIVYNSAISKTRKKQYKTADLDYSIVENYSADEIKEDVERLSDEEQKKIVNTILEKLNPEESILITLFYFDEKTTKDISIITGLSQSNVKVRLHRLRKRLLIEVQSQIKKSNKEIFK